MVAISGRTSARLFLLALALVVVVGAIAAPSAGPRIEPPPLYPLTTAPDAPNVVVLVTDDQRSFGMESMEQTMQIFRDRGVTYKPGFVTTPLCCPSRSSIFTGSYVHNHGVLTNTRVEGLDHSRTLQATLLEAGYRTGYFGKFLNGWKIENPPPNFHEWATLPGLSDYYDETWNLNGELRELPFYSSDVLAAYASDFIERASRDGDRPFLLFVATNAPHAPMTPEKDYLEADVPVWRGSPATRERDRSDKPRFVREAEAEDKTHLAEAQLRTLQSVDDLVGDVFGTLERTGEIDETLAFFISDNGVLWGEHGLGNKGKPYRPAVEVPFFARWPGHLPEGQVDNRMAANIDIAPTILDAALSRTPWTTDGRSLLKRWRRDELLLEYYHYAVFRQPSWASVRTRKSQYVEYYEGNDGRSVFREFYDLRDDPYQLHNLLANKSRRDDPNIERLRARLYRLNSCSGKDCFMRN